MRTQMKWTVLSIVMALLLIVLFGCGAASLEGEWVAADGYAPYGYPDEVFFFGDNKCAVDGWSGVYELKDGTLILSVMGEVLTFEYAKPDKSTMTLDDGRGKVAYVPASQAAKTTPAIEAASSDNTAASEVTPTENPEELRQQKIAEDVAHVQTMLEPFDLAGDVKGALVCIIEQIGLLEVTWQDEDFPSLEERKLKYMEDYRTQVLKDAKNAYEGDGYEAALSVLYDSLKLLSPDDENIQTAIEYYKGYGPVKLTDLEYFQSIDYMQVIVKDTVMDNTNHEHTDALAMTDSSTGERGLVYSIQGKYRTFSGVIFNSLKTRDSSGKFTLRIYGDDTLLFTSQTQTSGTFPEEFSVDVTGVSLLKLVFDSSGNWIAPYMSNAVLAP